MPIDEVRRQLAEVRQVGAHEIVDDVGTQQTQRGERSGRQRNEERSNAKLLGDGRGVDGAGPPNATRVNLERSTPFFAACSRISSAMRALMMRSMPDAALYAQTQGLGEMCLDRAVCRVDLDPLRATQEVARAEQPADDVGVRHRRQRSTATEACWPRHGTGAFRAHDQEPAAIHAGDGTAAGRDGDDVQAWHVDLAALDAAFGNFERLASLYESNIARRASDIHRDQVAELARRH